ncbi:MAG: HXXEE domain-containing protein, partial [Methanobacterium sp.]
MDPLFSISNSLTHIFAAFLKRKYNPGLAFSLILGIPVALYA